MQTEQIPVLKADEYPGGIWYYEPHTYQPYRYVLGRVGTHRWYALASTQHRPARCAGSHLEKCGAPCRRQRL